jgi:hypothetical protein
VLGPLETFKENTSLVVRGAYLQPGSRALRASAPLSQKWQDSECTGSARLSRRLEPLRKRHSACMGINFFCAFFARVRTASELAGSVASKKL